MQIFAFGDSITWGSWDREGGWTDRLKRSFYDYVAAHPETWFAVYNLGIPGETTDNLLQRFDKELACRIDPKTNEQVFLFQFGANDAAFIPSLNDFRCPVDRFSSNIRDVIHQAKKISSKIYLFTITPIDEATHVREDKVRKNEYVRQYNEILKQISTEEKVSCIDIFKAFTDNQNIQLLEDDGLHPNTAGHAVMYQLVKDRLSKDFSWNL